MEEILEVALYVWEYTKALLTTPQNAGILVLSWFAVEAVAPLGTFFVGMPFWSRRVRLTVYGFLRAMKNLAAIAWCSALVWVPYAQPPLCSETSSQLCQNEFERFVTGVVLGGALSGGHKFLAPWIRKKLGKPKRHTFICANCRKTIEVEYTADPCPKCGRTPHEVTSRG